MIFRRSTKSRKTSKKIQKLSYFGIKNFSKNYILGSPAWKILRPFILRLIRLLKLPTSRLISGSRTLKLYIRERIKATPKAPFFNEILYFPLWLHWLMYYPLLRALVLPVIINTV